MGIKDHVFLMKALLRSVFNSFYVRNVCSDFSICAPEASPGNVCSGISRDLQRIDSRIPPPWIPKSKDAQVPYYIKWFGICI